MENNMEVGFEKPNGMIDYMNYYEVESYCKKEISTYLNLYPALIPLYEEFSKDYTYFHPYFDFVVFQMGYIFLNPLLTNSKFGILSTETGTIDLSKTTQSPMYVSKRMNDQNLNIQPVFASTDVSSIITNDGIAFAKEKYISHETLLNHIMNQILIQNKEIYLDYINQQDCKFYLIHRLGFMLYGYYGDADIVLLYTPNLLSCNQREFYLYLKDYYPSDMHYVPSPIDVVERNRSMELIKTYQKTFTKK